MSYGIIKRQQLAGTTSLIVSDTVVTMCGRLPEMLLTLRQSLAG